MSSQVPDPYIPSFSFLSFSQNNPNTQQPGSDLDAQFDAIADTTTQLISRLSEVQRDDGALQNEVVSIDSLSSAVLALLSADGLNLRGLWVTATAYNIKDLVSYSGGSYVAVMAHTSGASFATDLAAGLWTIFADPPDANILTVNDFTGTGAQTTFTLTVSPTSASNTWVFVAGVYQRKNQYTVNDTSLIFNVAPGLGVLVEVVIGVSAVINAVADGSISTAKLANGVLSADTAGRAKMAAEFIINTKLSSTLLSGGTMPSANAANYDIANLYLLGENVGFGLRAVIPAIGNTALGGGLLSYAQGLGGASNLIVNATNGDGTLTVSADTIIHVNSSNLTKTTRTSVNDTGLQLVASSIAIDTGAYANNTWYHVWRITATPINSLSFPDKYIASLSSSAPTMPANYVYKAYIGPICTLTYSAIVGAGVAVPSLQKNKTVSRTAVDLYTTASAGVTAYAQMTALTTGTPTPIPQTMVKSVSGIVGRSASGVITWKLAPLGGTINIGEKQIYCGGTVTVDSIFGGIPFTIDLISNTFYYKMDTTGSVYLMKMTGFELV